MMDLHSSKQTILILAVTLTAVVMNGATGGWSRQLVIAMMAGAMLLAPNENRHGKWFGSLALLAVLLSLAAFLPSSWFSRPGWKAAADELGIELPATVSPQPWLSVESICLFVAGLAWTYYLTSKSWTRGERRWLCRGVALGSILLGAAYIALKLSGNSWPGSAYEDQFGPFPNKNQTASVLLVGGILTVGLINLPGRPGRSGRAKRAEKLAWTLGVVVLITALAVVGSRSGIVLFALGALGVSLHRMKVSTVAIASSAILLAITGLILSDAKILQKLSGDDGVVQTTAADGRWALYADSLKVVGASPLTGTGIGNFEDVFALYRDRSAAQNRALHPDSDLVWAVAELGIPTALLIVAIGLILLWLAHPWRAETRGGSLQDQTLRLACFAAAMALAANSIVDVPVHRFGALLPGVLALSLASHPRRKLARAAVSHRIVVAGCAATAAAGLLLLPDRPRPLDANRYLANAQRQLRLGDYTQASAEFERARFLRPSNAKLPFDEGRLWLDYSPYHAIVAWRECLARAGQLGLEGAFFNNIYGLAKAHPELQPELWLLADGKPALQVVALSRSDAKQSRQRLHELFAANPNLDGWSRDQVAACLKVFGAHHSGSELIELLARHEEWEPLCWRALSKAYAAKGEHRQAFEIISLACPPPDFGMLQTDLSLDNLRKEHLLSPESLMPALRLAYQSLQEGSHGRALEILRALSSKGGEPAIVLYLIAQCLAADSDHDAASQALLSYLDALGKVSG